MALSGSRRGPRRIDVWPGFVDALSAVLLVLVFLFVIVLCAQIFLARDGSGKDAALRRLDSKVTELSALRETERSALLARVAAAEKATAETAERAAATFLGLTTKLDTETRAATQARAAAATARDEEAAARREAARLAAALAGAETLVQESAARIADLGRRLDDALAEKSRVLARYSSDFFGRLQHVLGDRRDIRIAGDRFVVQSEVLFASGRATLDPAGRAELAKIAAALIELDAIIPKDIHWVLRVDGHTDKKPIVSRSFASNWALSSARATAVVQYLISKGVAPERLAAAGFGEFHPIEAGDGEEVNQRNRRIELKITEK